MAERIVIIGGVAAGMSAASRARRIAPHAEIVVLERGPAAAYGACGLPAFLAGQVPNLDALRAHPEEFFRQQRGIDLRTGQEVVEIQPARRRVVTRDGAGREEATAFDRLVLATGAAAVGLRGDDHPRLFRANTWEQAARLEAFLRQRGSRGGRAVVIGAGYIGMEIAEALAGRGLTVRLLEARASVLPSLDADMAELMATAARRGGERLAPVEIVNLARVEAILPAPRGIGLATSVGPLEAEFAVDASGLAPNAGLAAGAGVTRGLTGAIAVDERQQTNVPGIFAAGDCAESRHRITGAPAWIPLGAVANQQGRVAGQNAANGPVARYPGVLGSLVLRAFGWEAGRTGLGQEQAERAGFAVGVERIEANTVAGYRGERRVTLKWIFDRQSGRGLGMQVVGPPGTTLPRLHAAAVALTAGLRRDEIEHLDLAYAPEVAPVYDPLQIAAHRAGR